MAKLAEVLALCGELADGSEGSARLRGLLLDERFVSLEGLEKWADEALSEKSIPHRERAFQDIIVATGKWLGFEVEWGSYSKGPDGVWRSQYGSIVVEVKSEATFLKADEIKPLVERANESGAEKVLIVVGKGPTEGPEAVIKAQNLGCRIVDFRKLFKIAKLASANGLKASWFLGLLELSDPNLGKVAELLGQIPVPEPERPSGADLLDLLTAFLSPKEPRLFRRPPPPPFKGGKLWELIEAGLLRPGQELRAWYKGREYKAQVDDRGWIVYGGTKCWSPTEAGRHVTGSECNGWRFWRFRDVDGEWRPIDELRRRLGERRR